MLTEERSLCGYSLANCIQVILARSYCNKVRQNANAATEEGGGIKPLSLHCKQAGVMRGWQAGVWA